MKKINLAGAIVAIGGGSIGRSGPITTTSIDQEILRLTGKKSPKVLFLPTAQCDPQDYIDAFTAQYAGKLGCRVGTLFLYDRCPSRAEIVRLMNWADLVYVGGGNTLRMLRRWRSLGIDQLLVKAHSEGTILAGMSAGAMCWFAHGLSDCWRLDHDPSKAIAVRGLDLVPGLCNPHYHKETWRSTRVREVLARRDTISLGIDDNAALIIDGDQFRVITSQPVAWAYRTYWKNEMYHEEKLPSRGDLNLFRQTMVQV